MKGRTNCTFLEYKYHTLFIIYSRSVLDINLVSNPRNRKYTTKIKDRERLNFKVFPLKKSVRYPKKNLHLKNRNKPES